MDKATFWKLIEETKTTSKGDPLYQLTLLIEKLVKFYNEEEIIEFGFICREYMNQAYLADLWDAAYIIGSGCSDDGFMDARAWLIQQGKDIYEAALKDPEILVEVIEDGDDIHSGGIWGVDLDAFERKMGYELDYRKRRSRPHPKLDKSLTDDPERYAKFPKLAAKFGNEEERLKKMSWNLTEKERLLRQLNEERKLSRYSLAGIDPHKIIYSESGWTIKDIVAHLTAWEEESVCSLQAFQNGSAYKIENFAGDDPYNHEQYIKRKDLSVEQVFADWTAIREQFRAAFEAIPEAKMAAQMTLPWGEIDTPPHLIREILQHEQEHIREIGEIK